MSLSFGTTPSGPATTTLSLSKGQNISLTKHDPGLTKVTVGLGWDVNAFAGGDYDLDASAILAGANGKVRSDADFCFYNQLSVGDGSVTLTGDNRTGEGDGDDEQLIIDLTGVPADVQKIVFGVSIHSPEHVTFGQVRNAFIRVVNSETGNEDVRYDLSDDFSVEKAVIAGELFRKDGGWSFRAIGQGYANGLAGMARDYGINV